MYQIHHIYIHLEDIHLEDTTRNTRDRSVTEQLELNRHTTRMKITWKCGEVKLHFSPHPPEDKKKTHTQLAKMSFDKIFDLTAGVYFYFYNIPSSEN